MAKRIGAEKFTHWTKGVEQFGEEGEPRIVDTYSGCWPEMKTSDEAAGSAGIDTVLVGLWVPAKVEIHESDDYFTWPKQPDIKYRTAGKVGLLYTRRGQLRASYIPVEVRS